jgi:hypothetical protein
MGGKISQKQYDGSNWHSGAGPVVLLGMLVLAGLSAVEFTRILSTQTSNRAFAKAHEAMHREIASPFSPRAIAHES